MENIFYKNHIINPSTELVPRYSISPFGFNSNFVHLDKSNNNTDIKSESTRHFQNFAFTIKGRNAIFNALSHYNLKKDDVVTIITTSNNKYISGCVTKEIEKICSWSRDVVDNTKIIFVNHEFGYPYENLAELKRYKLPIIEDCAHTFFSQNSENSVGLIGDFVIYSLPKVFPVQVGGILKSNRNDVNLSVNQYISSDCANYINDKLNSNYFRIDFIKEKRLANYSKMVEKFANLGISPFFKMGKDIIPGVFLFKWDDNINYNNLKIFMQRNGVESSVFYGKNAFFIPIHEFLGDDEIEFFYSLFSYFKENS